MTLDQLQQTILINWFNVTYPQYGQDLHHFANERRCSWQYGKILKGMGVKPGVLDLHLALPNSFYHGLWLELKYGKSRLSKEQIKFIARKNETGYCAIAVWGNEKAKEVIVEYLNFI